MESAVPTTPLRQAVAGAGEERDYALPDGTMLEMTENARFTVERADTRAGYWDIVIALQEGGIRLEVPPAAGKQLVVRTACATAGVRGTDFAVEVEGEATQVEVFAGEVLTGNGSETKPLTADRAARIERRRLRLEALRQERRARWQDMRNRLVERWAQRFNLSAETDTASLRAVLQQLPEARRQRLMRHLQQRREQLRQRRAEIADTVAVRRAAIADSIAARREALQARREAAADSRAARVQALRARRGDTAPRAPLRPFRPLPRR